MNDPTLVQLDRHLKELYLTAMREQYRSQAEEAAQANWPYETYLATLITLEVERRTRNRRKRRIQEARFPLLKELADFDFAALPQINKQQVLTLAQGHYLAQAESVILVGNSGLGKTQPD